MLRGNLIEENIEQEEPMEAPVEAPQMVTSPMVTGSAVPNFIESFIDEAERGLKNKGYTTCSEGESHIKLELYATEVREKGAGLKIRVLSLGGKKSDTNAQKMMVYAKKESKVEEAENKARIAKAQDEEKKTKKSIGGPKLFIA